jgi:hypothetical protein
LLGRIGASYASDFDASLPTFLLQGDIAEIIIIPRAITATERQALERYASAKYNIPLA